MRAVRLQRVRRLRETDHSVSCTVHPALEPNVTQISGRRFDRLAGAYGVGHPPAWVKSRSRSVQFRTGQSKGSTLDRASPARVGSPPSCPCRRARPLGRPRVPRGAGRGFAVARPSLEELVIPLGLGFTGGRTVRRRSGGDSVWLERRTAWVDGSHAGLRYTEHHRTRAATRAPPAPAARPRAVISRSGVRRLRRDLTQI